MALVAKALAHPARIRIVRLLAAQTECRGHEVFSELPLAQSTISEHLRVLKESGLVRSKPVGTAMTYCLIASELETFQRQRRRHHDTRSELRHRIRSMLRCPRRARSTVNERSSVTGSAG